MPVAETTRVHCTVRLATAEDLPRMGQAAEAFYASSKFLRGFNLEIFSRNWTALLATQVGVIYLAEAGERVVGAISGLAYPDLNSGEMMGQEAFFFLLPEVRNSTAALRLFRSFERWAVEKKCRQVRIGHLLDSMPERMDRFYRKMGYEPIEKNYSKDIVI